MVTALVAIAAFVAGATAIDRLHPYSAADPDSESSRAPERIHEQIGIDPDAGLIALVETPEGARSEAARVRVERIADRIFLDPAVGLVATYYSTHDPEMVSLDGRETYVVANFETLSDRSQQRSAERLRERLADEPGVSFGGEAPGNVDVKEIVSRDIARAELLAFPLLLLLSFWFFRGLVAALLPVVVGALAISGGIAALTLLNLVLPVSVFALNLVLGLALGLAVDYSLLIVSRYREEAGNGVPAQVALRTTLETAGRTVFFSALCVSCAMAALLVFPQRFLYSMGIGGILVPLVAAAAALVVLPAALVLLGERVNALAPRRLQRAAASEARPATSGGWYRLSRLVMRRPGPIAAVSAAVLIALGIPFLHARFQAVDTSVLPADAESRQVREALTERFPPNPTLPLILALDSRPNDAVRQFADSVGAVPGVADVAEPTAVGGGTSLVYATPEPGPLTTEAERLVDDIRALEAPFDVAVGGRAADHVDQKDSITAHLPVALALLCATTLAILFAMTASIVIPIKAVLMNLLTLSAAMGALVLIFQDGRFEGLLDYSSPGALELSQPLVLLAVGFGLSTDYGVFLLARIQEARDRGVSDSEAVALGLERAGRIVTAAALLICVAIGAFATSEIVFIKELGLGIAIAVLIDATIVRALLVPSLMQLLGRWNWWLPEPLVRLHRRLFREPGAPPHPRRAR